MMANEEFPENPSGVVFKRDVTYYNYNEQEVETEYKHLQTILSKKFSQNELEDYGKVIDCIRVW